LAHVGHTDTELEQPGSVAEALTSTAAAAGRAGTKAAARAAAGAGEEILCVWTPRASL